MSLCSPMEIVANGGRQETGSTVLKFYQQRMQVWPGKTLGRFGRLFHEYVIDQYCKVERNNLQYLRTHQRELRASSNSTERLEDSPIGNSEGRSWVYLPPSFIGGDRYYHTKYLNTLNALNAVNKLGAASYFVTMTTNPRCKEILDCLGENETAQDRPDIVARVFKMKYDALLDDMVKKNVLGRCIG
jgi:hypothetical protein